ncbi:MAG: ribbon-helix-helix domain-containing protein [Solirubrobacterales bacterium]
MAQLVTRVDDQLAGEVDQLVADGVVRSRSEAVRLGLERLTDAYRRQQIGAQIVDAYGLAPQTEQELSGIDEATRALIDEEPW